ncbi:hypothetical protein [Gottfriedia acidiceleris]|uniref:hypothetical protein n=1 Tax=Gottfriedia acidiceleris TaxID=371036 RepID=UPI00300066E2
MMDQLPELHKRILLAIPSGSENAITIAWLMDKLAISRNDRRTVSAVIESLVLDHGFPIGTSSKAESKGIFLCKTEDDLKLACHTLNSMATQTLKRHKQLIANYNKGVKTDE